MIRLFLGFALLFSLSACTSKQSTRPNVVIVLLDDMGFSDFGFMGSEIPTPHIDQLAANGTTYTQFYVYPRCSPTRAALMTGKYPHEVGMGFLALPEDIKAPKGPYQGYLDPDVMTIADDFKHAGYKTYMSGKWHLGESPEYWPLNYGFDRYFGLISGASSFYELLPQPGGRTRKMALDGEPWFPPRNGFFMTDAITDQAVSYLSNHNRYHEEEPFFLYVAYTAPHFPLHAEEEDIAAMDGLYKNELEITKHKRRETLLELGVIPTGQAGGGPKPSTSEDQLWKDNMQVYAAMIKSADDGIGELVETLKSKGEFDNTVFLIFSDNGASAEDVSSRGLHKIGTTVGQRGSYVAYGPKGAGLSNFPLKDFKGSTYEGGIRSPLIIHGKSIAAGNIDNQTIVSVLDIKPALQAISANQASQANGTTLFDSAAAPKTLYWEHLGWKGVRKDQWKAVYAPNRKVWELYDIATDPSESNNLAKGHPDIVQDLSVAWSGWSKDVNAEPLPMETLLQWYRPNTSDQ